MPLSDSFAEFGTLIAAAITAVATGALAWVAWHELRAVRLGLEEEATAREQDYIALADQLAVAREQLDLARRPFAIAHRPSEGHMAVVQSWAEVDILAPGEEHVLRWTRVSSTWSATPPYGLLCETTCYDEAGEPRTLVTAFRAKRAL